jgi:serine/threonine-protein kinase
MIRAVDFYNRAIARDPGYALPYVGISDVFNIFGQWAYIHPREAYTRSKEALQKALEIDDTLSELYSSLGFLTGGYEWDYPAAAEYYRRSLEINPHNAYAHAWYAINLAARQKREEAIAEAKNAVEVDPLFNLFQALFGIVLVICGQPERGRDELLKAIAKQPDQPMPYLFLGLGYLLPPSLPEKAIEYLEKAVGFGLTFALGWLGFSYALVGRKDDALMVLDRLEKTGEERFIPAPKKIFFYFKPGLKPFRFLKRKYVAPFLKALVYLGLNRQEEALGELEKSALNRDYYLPGMLLRSTLPVLPHMSEFTSHPRFKALREKIKLP